MKLSRREWLKYTGGAAATPLIPLFESGCSLGRPEPRLIVSRAPLPELFRATLPLPPTLKPVRSDADTDYFELTAKESSAAVLPGLRTKLWAYNGVLPGPTFDVRTGRQSVVKLRNALPVPIVNHLHGGRTPAESDGYPSDFIVPVTGFKQSPLCTSDAAARTVVGEKDYTYPNNQRAATLWYHDHRMDFTAPQAYRGLAGFYIIRDEEEDRLPLPRDQKEIPLMICDRSFDADGSFLYPSLDATLLVKPGVQAEYRGGVLGDVILVNGAPWPTLEVANTKYRFRILNASNARRYELALDPDPAGGNSFTQIGSDGGLLGSPLTHRTIRIVPAQRFDVIIDFSKFPIGSQVTLRNLMDTGPLGQIMRFHITRDERDDTYIPEHLSVLPPLLESSATVTRIFNFSYSRSSGSWTINGKPFNPARMDAQPQLESTEIWQFETDFNHPLHLHLVHFQILSHAGRPTPWDAGWKDTIDLGPGQGARVIIRFLGYQGRYVFHCHNLEHEDMAMMGNFEVV